MPVDEVITLLIITFNEAPNIGRTPDKVAWARRIIVVDSGRTDGTLDVLLVQGYLFDSWPGWFYAVQRVLAECMIALELIERRIRGISLARK